ncbi:MAG: DinB family protein [Acidobacteria bacterium]|nr:DinB family protein [Acidobacteriota bacterium]
MRLTILASLFSITALAQNPLTADIKGNYDTAKTNLIKAAEKMPEEHYSFKPTPEVRSFGQLIGHVADATMAFCAGAAGEKNPARGFEKSKSSKADLVAAIKEGFAFCDPIVNGMNDAKGAEMTKFFGRDRTRLGVLSFNNMHNYEHYGNIVTYMRIKGLVPPSSEGR